MIDLQLRKLVAKDVSITLTAVESRSSLLHARLNEQAFGRTLSKAQQKISHDQRCTLQRRLWNKDYWAWCDVTLDVFWRTFHGYSSVCCCSFNSEEEFRSTFSCESMLEEALEQLNEKVARDWGYHWDVVAPLIEFR